MSSTFHPFSRLLCTPCRRLRVPTRVDDGTGGCLGSAGITETCCSTGKDGLRRYRPLPLAIGAWTKSGETEPVACRRGHNDSWSRTARLARATRDRLLAEPWRAPQVSKT